jgi:hypothetical protein
MIRRLHQKGKRIRNCSVPTPSELQPDPKRVVTTDRQQAIISDQMRLLTGRRSTRVSQSNKCFHQSIDKSIHKQFIESKETVHKAIRNLAWPHRKSHKQIRPLFRCVGLLCCGAKHSLLFSQAVMILPIIERCHSRHISLDESRRTFITEDNVEMLNLLRISNNSSMVSLLLDQFSRPFNLYKGVRLILINN